VQPAGRVLECFGHVNGPAEKVEPPDTEAADLAGTEAGIGGEGDQRAVGRRHGGREVDDLLG
jgi:hypothetical protein